MTRCHRVTVLTVSNNIVDFEARLLEGTMRRLFLTLALLTIATTSSAQTGETSGSLTVLDGEGKAKVICPLKHTDVNAEISGFIFARGRYAAFSKPSQRKD